MTDAEYMLNYIDKKRHNLLTISTDMNRFKLIILAELNALKLLAEIGCLLNNPLYNQSIEANSFATDMLLSDIRAILYRFRKETEESSESYICSDPI